MVRSKRSEKGLRIAMGVLQEGSWCCFLAGRGKSERVKVSMFTSKGPALAAISVAVGAGGVWGWGGGGTGFLIHRNLLLTTHAILPTVVAAEAAEVRLCHGRLSARLVPQRFFITSSILDLTVVGLDIMGGDSSSQVQQPQYLKTCCKPSLQLGTTVFLLGHTDKKELTFGEGKVVIATDNLIKLTMDGVTLCPGSAGFDAQGNLAFMACDPMKLASSPSARSYASSSSTNSWKKDVPMQFGIPIPVICNWLYQHWEGSLDEVSKPKLSLIRLMTTGQCENSNASFTFCRVIKTNEDNNDRSSSSQMVQRSKYYPGSSSSANGKSFYNENPMADLRLTPEQGILSPEFSGSVEKKDHASLQLLDVSMLSKAPKSIFLPLPLRQMLSDEANVEGYRPGDRLNENGCVSEELTRAYREANHKVPPVSTWPNNCFSEVQSSSCPLENGKKDGFDSGEETMYSAETMESRNIPSPQQNKLQTVARSQSCVNYSRWTFGKQNTVARKAVLLKQHTIIPIQKLDSQAAALPQRSHDYCSPTVSSSLKKRNSLEQMTRPHRNVIQVSPRWMF
ncbi:uncharacterized protein LOC135587651 isoform X1 [Musa acuminata AAA Group]|uniref:uncharacterized protein LOC135587651 isoform X1 n=1 Tax=Musa acuminata AAA Group TaxID=214697 RepID=UPI0031D9D639